MKLGKAGLSTMGLVALVAAMAPVAPVAAEERGFGQAEERVRVYLGAAGGATKMKDPQAVFLGDSSLSDTKDTGYKAFIGVEIQPHAAIELSYIDFGKFKIEDPLGLTTGFPFFDEWKARAVGLAYVGGVSVNKFVSFHLKLGGLFWKVEDSGTFNGVAFANDESGTSFSFGAGTQFNFGRWVAARLEYEIYTDVGDARLTGRSDIELISASLLFRI